MTEESATSISLRRHIRGLANLDPCHIRLVHVHTHSQYRVIPERHDRIGRRPRVTYRLPRMMMLPQNNSVDRRANERLFITRLRLGQLRASKSECCSRTRYILFASLVVQKRIVLLGLLMPRLGYG